MRTILFRGKSHEGKWVEGDLSFGCRFEPWIEERPSHGARGSLHLVARESVGQMTGAFDSQHSPIFEGDILALDNFAAQVVYKDASFCMKVYCKRDDGWEYLLTQRLINLEPGRWKVSGNAFDNPLAQAK